MVGFLQANAPSKWIINSTDYVFQMDIFWEHKDTISSKETVVFNMRNFALATRSYLNDSYYPLVYPTERTEPPRLQPRFLEAKQTLRQL